MSDKTTFEHVTAGLSGHVGEYDVWLSGDTVRVIEDVRNGRDVTREVDGLGEFVDDADAFRLGWAELPDYEVIYLYDRADDGFGYAVNLDNPRFSEWGYAPISLLAND